MQSALVVVIVIACAVYALWRLLPARRRLALLEHLIPARAKRGRLVRLRDALRQQTAGGCDACALGPTRVPRTPRRLNTRHRRFDA